MSYILVCMTMKCSDLAEHTIKWQGDKLQSVIEVRRIIDCIPGCAFKTCLR